MIRPQFGMSGLGGDECTVRVVNGEPVADCPQVARYTVAVDPTTGQTMTVPSDPQTALNEALSSAKNKLGTLGNMATFAIIGLAILMVFAGRRR